VTLSLLGGGVGLALAFWGVPVLTKMSGIPRADEIGLSVPVLAFALLISLATGLVFGLLPAWQSSRTDVFRHAERRAQRRRRCRASACSRHWR
jgi:ABC-type antimicrobial peptide transport system permease subunit